jgi:hypothetical protein
MDLGKTYFTSRDTEFPTEIRELNEIEAKEVKDAYTVLHKFDYFLRRFIEIELNRDDYFRTIDRYAVIFKEDRTGKSAGYDYQRLAFIDINRAFINLISSFKSFIEHILNYLEQLYGNSSLQFLEIKKLSSSLYDGYLSYKLLIRLRDFAIHANYPIQSVHFDREHDGKGGFNYKIKVQFNKSVFLKNKALRKKLGNDLDSYGELFDVKPFIIELMTLLERFFKAFIKVDEKSFLPSAELIKKLSEEAKTENIGVTILEMDGAYLKHNTKIIPVKMSKDFYKALD